MKILVVGKNGQVGYELERRFRRRGEVISVGRNEMDLTNLDQVRHVIRTVKPTLLVNAAAYTDVDRAESEPELAMRINAEAPAAMAEEVKKLAAAMIHYSTDYVFDGSKSAAYEECDLPCPINVYGQSKLAGEQLIQAAGIPHIILRTSWVYSKRGSNFLLTVLRLAQEHRELCIVDDKYGAPTSSRMIADATIHIIEQLGLGDEPGIVGLPSDHWREDSGLYHFAAVGQTTWHGFANAILAQASSLPKKPVVKAITSAEYPLLARRPANSSLNCSRFIDRFGTPLHWEDALKNCIRDQYC